MMATEAVEVAGAVRARLAAVDWTRVLLGLIITFHGGAAVTLLAAPARQIVTAGTLPVLELVPGWDIPAHRAAWAVVYAAATLALLLVWHQPTVRHQWTAWLLVIPTGFIWAGAFAIALIDGAGSALGLVIWIHLLSMWGAVAVAIGVREPAPDGR